MHLIPFVEPAGKTQAKIKKIADCHSGSVTGNKLYQQKKKKRLLMIIIRSGIACTRTSNDNMWSRWNSETLELSRKTPPRPRIYFFILSYFLFSFMVVRYPKLQ
jgi:hypothetical protein